MAESIKIKLTDSTPVKINMGEKVDIKYVDSDHAKMDNLDYENSGHTGFMPAKLNLLESVDQQVKNDRLVLPIFNTQTETTNTISLDELSKRIITKSDKIDETNEIGQYVFLEI